MRKLPILTVAALLIASIGSTAAQAKGVQKPSKCHSKMELRTLERCQSHAVKYAKTVVGFWQNNSHLFPRGIPRIVHREYSRLKWLRRELNQTRAKLQPRITVKYYSAWMCIHSGEGAWNANTGNGYYGGLQMNYGFMAAYGGHLLRAKGTADKWSPMEQMMVAERAHDSGRGFHPWPTTARNCGLI